MAARLWNTRVLHTIDASGCDPPSVHDAGKLRTRPSVPFAEANFAALRDKPLLSDKQVRWQSVP